MLKKHSLVAITSTLFAHAALASPLPAMHFPLLTGRFKVSTIDFDAQGTMSKLHGTFDPYSELKSAVLKSAVIDGELYNQDVTNSGFYDVDVAVIETTKSSLKVRINAESTFVVAAPPTIQAWDARTGSFRCRNCAYDLGWQADYNGHTEPMWIIDPDCVSKQTIVGNEIGFFEHGSKATSMRFDERARVWHAMAGDVSDDRQGSDPGDRNGVAGRWIGVYEGGGEVWMNRGSAIELDESWKLRMFTNARTQEMRFADGIDREVATGSIVRLDAKEMIESVTPPKP